MRYSIYFMCIGILLAQKPSILASGFKPFDSNPYLTPTSSPTISININWNTEKKEQTTVAYGPTKLLNDTISIPGVRNHHHVMLFNLFPDAQYYYKVLPNGNLKNFRTFPYSPSSFPVPTCGFGDVIFFFFIS